MTIAANAPMLSDAPSLVDTTNTNLVLFAILQALDPASANLLPDDVITSLVGSETLS
jgi:hypothetical protein